MRIREVVVTGQRKVELQTRELDEALAPNEAMIETAWSFISAGTELANYMGRDANVFKPGTWCAYPWRSGYGNVGTVRAVGSGVTRVKVGQRVFSYGNHASFVKYDAEGRLAIPVPDAVSSDLAAASRMAGVAFTSLILTEIKGAPWVAVFGLGAVGNLAAQGFAARGCKVVGIDPVEFRRALAKKCGVATTISGTPEEVRKLIKDVTGGAGANIAIDAVGHTAVVREAVAVAAPFGQVVLLGSPRVPVEGNFTPLLSEVHTKFLTMRGALEWCLPIYPTFGAGVSQHEKQEMIFTWLAAGTLNLAPLVSHRLAPEKIAEAYEGLETQPAEYTGVALNWG